MECLSPRALSQNKEWRMEKMKVCKYCGKEITEPRRKFCNLECRKSFYDSEEEKKKRREYMRRYNDKYFSKEENSQKRREYMRIYMKEYFKDEEHREKRRELSRKQFRDYRNRNREKLNAYCRERYHKIKNGEWKNNE